MKILIYGATGFTGGNISREAVARGHEVIGVARSLPETTPDGVTLVAGNVDDASGVAALADGVDAIVVAVKGHTTDGALPEAVPGLLAAAAASGARLGVVGGAGSLSREPGGPRLIDGAFPEAFRPEGEAMAHTLDALKADESGVDWFMVSPSQNYGAHAPGERRGSYRVGGDELITDAEGVSAIGGEDFAIAFVDELERPAHQRTRFTVGY